MHIELRPQQREAVNKLHSGAILWADVGTGKSRTALAYFLEKECGGSLFIEKNEVVSFSPRDLYIITTAQKRDKKEWNDEARPFGIFEDGSGIGGIHLTVDSWNNIGKYTGIKGAFFIFDEQRVVGSGKWARSFLKIAKLNRWILLTATPGDTWSDYAPVFIANGFYSSFKDFRDSHVIWERWSKYPKVKGYYDEGILLKHRNDLLVRMENRKETVPHHETIYLEWNREVSKSIIRDRWNPYLNQPIVDAGELCRVLRKIANEDPSRMQTVKELIVAHPKAIIFYNFDYELEMLRTLSTVVAEWNGHRHEPLPTGNRWVYLVQYSAGAEGWNCITTDTIIFYSQNYSYKLMTQAAGRIDRMNTPFVDLYYFHLSSRSPIDLAIARALSRKKNFNEKDFAGF